MKKIFLILLCLTLILITSCSSTKKGTLTISLGGEPAEILFWEKIIKDFEKEKGIEVNFVRKPADTDQRRQELVIALKSKKADPDLFLMDVCWSAQFAASGWLENLDPYIASDNVDMSVFFKKVVKIADVYEGQTIALPIYVDGGLLYYRKDLLKKYGYTAPPKTWDQLINYAKKIQAGERVTNPNFHGFCWQGVQYEGLVCNFLEYAGSNNGGIIIGNDKITVNSPQNIKAIQLMHDLIHKHKVSPQNIYTEMKEDDCRMMFQEGNALFERNWPYAWPLHESKESNVKGKTGIAPLPKFPGGKSVATLGGWHIGLSKFSDAKDKAWEFMKYVTSYKVQKAFALNLGWNPGRTDAYNDSEVLKKLPHFKKLKAVFANTLPRPNIPYYSRVSEVLQKHVNSAIAGNSSPEKAMAAAQEEVDRIVERYTK